MIPPAAFLVLAALLFILGIIAFFVKKDLLTQFMAVEVMLNAGNLAFLALTKALGKADGQIVVLFIITVAAAEAVIGLWPSSSSSSASASPSGPTISRT